MSFAVSKKVLSDTGIIKLQITDPLYINSYRTREIWYNYNDSSTFRSNSRAVVFSFSCKFGQNANSNKQKENMTDEAKRMGI